MWLVPEAKRKLTPNRYHAGQDPSRIKPIEAVIYHYTASLGFGPTLQSLCMSRGDIEAYCARLDAKFPRKAPHRRPPASSAHFLIDRDGSVFQLASLSDRTWHAGGETSRLFGAQNVNGRSIGIEIMNVGPLIERRGELFTVAGATFTGAVLEAGGPPNYEHTLWEPYTTGQVEAVRELTHRLSEVFPVLRGNPRARLIGHEHVDPSRKIDPGPAFPWGIIRGGV